jgi:hypothetical protein
MSWNVRFHEIPNQTETENFSFLSWKTKKFYSWKIYDLSHMARNSSFLNQHLNGAILEWRFWLSRSQIDFSLLSLSRHNVVARILSITYKVLKSVDESFKTNFFLIETINIVKIINKIQKQILRNRRKMLDFDGNKGCSFLHVHRRYCKVDGQGRMKRKNCRLSTKTPYYQLVWAVLDLCRQLDIRKCNFHFV